MAITIDSAFIEEYRNLVLHTVQQQTNKLRNFVTEVSSGGEAYNFERLGPTEMVEKTGRRVDTVYADDEWSRRVAVPRTWTNTMTVEHEDKVQMLVDPQSNYHKAQGMAVARQYDDIIIEACGNDALDGDGNLISFPASQDVGPITQDPPPVDFDLVTQVQEKFMENEIDIDIPKVMVVSPSQVRTLWQDEKAISADYVNREALQTLTSTGIVTNWMGFTWIVSNRLHETAPNNRQCLAFTMPAIGLAINQELLVRIGEDPSKSYMWQTFVQMTAGAVRVEDEQIVHMHCHV